MRGAGHNHDDQDMQDSASVCVHPDTISGTHDVNNVLKKLEVQETSIQESKPNDGGSSLRGLADINTNPGCVQKSVKGGLGGVVYTRTHESKNVVKNICVSDKLGGWWVSWVDRCTQGIMKAKRIDCWRDVLGDELQQES